MLIQRQPVTATAQVIEGHPGAILTLSADGDASGTGILWMTYALMPPGEDATSDTRRGQLAAYDAENLGRLLWHSDMAADQRDDQGRTPRRCLLMSASLIGHSGSSAFRLSTTTVSMS